TGGWHSEGCPESKCGPRASVSISHFRFVFTVNLLGENGDIVFHFNPRMNENEVVCNTKQNGGWGKEERWPIPFEAGATFMMIIDVMSDCYRVRLPAGHIHSSSNSLLMACGLLILVAQDGFTFSVTGNMALCLVK
uniref:Galectin n=1 Tax=Podarcis muralis TaxID=64176 RepID=A0A670IT35_PODMU